MTPIDKTLCGWFISGDPERPCVKKLGHRSKHYDAAYLAQRREYQLEYDRAHRDEKREYKAQYYQANREEIRERERERNQAYRQSEAGKESRRRSDHNRRAREVNAITGPLPTDLTGYLGDLYGWECQICRCPLTRETLTLDHVVPLSVYPMHVLFNLQPACLSCNSSKNASLDHLDDRELSLIALLRG